MDFSRTNDENSNKLPSLQTFCEILCLRYDHFEALWAKTHTHPLSFHQHEFAWLLEIMEHSFRGINEANSEEILYDFGFQATAAAKFSEKIKEYPHFHPSDLISDWMKNMVRFEPRCGPLYHPLPKEYSILSERNIGRHLSSDLGIQGSPFIVHIQNSIDSEKGPEIEKSIREREKAPQTEVSLWLYHGTTRAALSKILNDDFDPDTPPPFNRLTDFGPGYYFSVDFNVASFFAKRHLATRELKSPGPSEEERRSLSPVVLAYVVDPSEWSSSWSIPKQKLLHVQVQSSDWHHVVRTCYSGQDLPTNYRKKTANGNDFRVDILSGSVSIGTRESRVQTDMIQYCFRTTKGRKWLSECEKYLFVEKGAGVTIRDEK